MEERIIELSVDNRSEVIKLPINPKTVEITSKQLNQTITLLEMGEVNLPGDCGLKRTKFSSFFPSENSPFSSRAEDTPKGYITMLDEWKTSKKVVRVIVTDMDINLAMLMDELNYSGNEGDEDIYYTMSFSEYVTLNVPTVNTHQRSGTMVLQIGPIPAPVEVIRWLAGILCGGSQRNIMGMGHSIRRYMVQIAERLKRQPRAMEKAVPGTGIGFIRVLCFRFLHKGGGRNEITDRRKGYQPAN